jgi:ABC-type antimicrobial peptide transport system permease subunit
MDIIAITFLFACVVYLMHFGYKSIISNYYEIGIISALGCNNKDIGKLFLLEILTVGLGILGVSLIGMYVGTFLSNMVLIETFEFVFDIAFTNIDVVIFDWNYVIIDLIIAMVIIVISALFPMFYIRKVKPVNILKAKE